MPGRMSFVFLMEAVLVLSTTLLLIQPKFIFRTDAQWLKNLGQWVAMFLLCLTFCWSVILGIALGVSGLTFSL